MNKHLFISILVIISLAACATYQEQSIESVNTAPASETDQIVRNLSTQLGREVKSVVTHTNKTDHWKLICGQPLEPDGQPFDYSRSPFAGLAKEGLVDNYYCALFERANNGLILRELSVGSTDSPVIDWIETYNLPSTLFSE